MVLDSPSTLSTMTYTVWTGHLKTACCLRLQECSRWSLHLSLVFEAIKCPTLMPPTTTDEWFDRGDQQWQKLFDTLLPSASIKLNDLRHRTWQAQKRPRCATLLCISNKSHLFNPTALRSTLNSVHYQNNKFRAFALP